MSLFSIGKISENVYLSSIFFHFFYEYVLKFHNSLYYIAIDYYDIEEFS